MPLYILDLFGVAVFAASGVLAAARKQMDLLGAIVLAAATAIGGGTLRDLLLDRHPVFWMTDPAYLAVILVSALLTLAYVRHRPAPRGALGIADALGLAVFTVGGAQVAERAGESALIVVMMATMTGVAGGALRDVLSAEIPVILRRGDLYATASIAGAATYLLLKAYGPGVPFASGAAMAVVMLVRLAANTWGLQLPAVTARDD